jgi:hypothetical protein
MMETIIKNILKLKKFQKELRIFVRKKFIRRVKYNFACSRFFST